MLLLLLALACEAPAPPPAEPAAEAGIAGVRQGLQAAHRAWSDGRYAEARQGVMRTYRERFEPLEPALRAADPRATLALEHGFAVMADTLGRKGNPVQVARELREFVAEIEEAGLLLPAAPAAAPAPPSAPATIAVPVRPPSGG